MEIYCCDNIFHLPNNYCLYIMHAFWHIYNIVLLLNFSSLELGETTVLTFEAAQYPRGFMMSLHLTFHRVPGPQNYFFSIALNSTTDGVTAGGLIGVDNPQEVFAVANITIRDDSEPLNNV